MHHPISPAWVRRARAAIAGPQLRRETDAILREALDWIERVMLTDEEQRRFASHNANDWCPVAAAVTTRVLAGLEVDSPRVAAEPPRVAPAAAPRGAFAMQAR